MHDKDKEPTCVWENVYMYRKTIFKSPLTWFESTCGVSGRKPLEDWQYCPYCGKRLEVKDE